MEHGTVGSCGGPYWCRGITVCKLQLKRGEIRTWSGA